MPLLINFTVVASHVKWIPLFSDTPFILIQESLILEIACKKGHYLVSSNTEIQINCIKRYFARLKDGDLIFFQNQFILFKQHTNTGPDHPPVGNWVTGGINTFFYKLPQMVDASFFTALLERAESHPAVDQIDIDCGNMQYMNNQAVAEMLDMISQLEAWRIRVSFHNPGHKFKSYLKLANIENKIPIRYPNATPMHSPIEALRACDFFITRNHQEYIIQSGMVCCVGRSPTNSHIYIADRYVSRIHALIVNIHPTLYLIDCCSGNHTFINAQKIKPLCVYRLFAEDLLSFGGGANFQVTQKRCDADRNQTGQSDWHFLKIA